MSEQASNRFHQDGPPIRILSLDGGGPFGLITARLLQRLYCKREDYLDHVDFLTGTSSGAVIAAILNTIKDRKIALQFAVDTMKKLGEFYISGVSTPSTVGAAMGQNSFTDYENFSRHIHDILHEVTLEGVHELDVGIEHIIIPTFSLNHPYPNTEVPLNAVGFPFLPPVFDHVTIQVPPPIRRRWTPILYHNIPPTAPDGAVNWLERPPKEAYYPDLLRDGYEPTLSLSDAVLRACATPVFSPVYEDHIDGGAFAGNPGPAALSLVMHLNRNRCYHRLLQTDIHSFILPNQESGSLSLTDTHDEAEHILHQMWTRLRVLSVGSGIKNYYMPSSYKRQPWGYQKWLFDQQLPFALIFCMIDGSQEFQHLQLQGIMPPHQYNRLNAVALLNQEVTFSLQPKTYPDFLKMADEAPLDRTINWLENQW